MARLVQVRTLRTAQQFRAHLDALGVTLPFDDHVPAGGPLAQPLAVFGRVAGNRFAILPMEGWDGTDDGRPTELVTRRWRRFGESGAGLMWGGEAIAVRADGRANARQLVIAPELAPLREELLRAHPDPEKCVVGLQLTHSGRWSAPGALVAYEHPFLDARVGPVRVLTDDELDDLVADFVRAAVIAQAAGFDFVDVKHCHGYLLHELLSAHTRPGRYGGDLDGRMRFLTEVVRGIRRDAPGLGIGVRLSAFDVPPHRDGEPEATAYSYAFGGDGENGVDLGEPHAFLTRCETLGIRAVSITAGSPYYCPHVQRPAYFPPTDGYAPPRDPLIEVGRMLGVTAELRRAHPSLAFIGSGYSYLQEWLPHVAQAAVSNNEVDAVGIGRLALSYPTLPADVLHGTALERRLLCRTFSDCTSAPRNGLVSGCYPLDEFYKARPERRVLAKVKRA